MLSLMKARSRCREPELMDQPGLDAELHRQALVGLRRVNVVSGTVRALWNPIRQLAEGCPERNIRVLDLACGGGDVARGLAAKARRSGVPLHVDGCDISPVAVAHAQSALQHSGLDNVRFFGCDVLEGPLPDDIYDVVTCSLFLHHLDERDAVRVLRRMGQLTRRLVLVDDLCRSRWGYWMAWFGSRLLTRSPIVHIDGPLSVNGAFTLDEARRLALEAGLTGAHCIRHWPARFLLSWNKP